MQATIVFTPLLARLQGDKISNVMWASCIASVIGTSLIVLDGTPDQAAVGSLLHLYEFRGDLMVLAAALFYSITTVRISYYTHLVPAAVLGASKLTGLATFAIAAAALQLARES